MGRDHETTYWLQTSRAETAGVESAHIQLCLENGWLETQITDGRLGERDSCRRALNLVRRLGRW